jgi:hypothetical protein
MDSLHAHMIRSRFREAGLEELGAFLQRGFKQRHLFPHRIFYLPKCGPDGFKLATRMRGPVDLSQLWEVILYATSPVIDRFPLDLFFDRDIVWHQQHFGKAGQVATANLVLEKDTLYSMVHQSDLVQRISRRRELKTQVENRFKGWNHLLLNSIVCFAVEHNLRTVHLPTADFALRHTDPKRNVGRELFERIYDRTVHELYHAERRGDWWVVEVARNRGRVVVPPARTQSEKSPKSICVCHDVERGYGHTDADPRFAQLAHREAPGALKRMLEAEGELGVKATYHVVGSILAEVRDDIEAGGHCIGFHSFDHPVQKKDWFWNWRRKLSGDGESQQQLPQCRNVDYRIKGYRPPQSAITSELSDQNLCFHNFEWFASSAASLGDLARPELKNRVVRLPILFDDYDLYLRKLDYAKWERMALRKIEENHFVAFSLHDCYAQFWLPHYRRFLGTLKSLGELRTFDEVAGQVLFSNSH